MKKLVIICILALATVPCFAEVAKKLNIVPYPESVTIEEGSFNVAGSSIRYEENIDDATKALAERFASQLSLTTGKKSVVKKGKGKGINLILDSSLAEEAYNMTIGNKSIEIYASSLRGFNWGVQSLKQIMPVEIYGKAAAAEANWSVPCCTITDAPRFGYRGLLIDEARHFFGEKTYRGWLNS